MSDMTFVPDNEGAAKFSRAFVNMLITWNNIEVQARSLLGNYSGGGLGTFIAVNSLGAPAACDALRAVAEQQLPEASDHLKHFAKCMDLYRAHRNFYVHSLHCVGSTSDGQNSSGVLMGWDVKGTIQRVEDYIETETLEKLGEDLEQLRVYGFRLSEALKKQPKNALAVSSGQAKEGPWPDKPARPEVLEKRRQGLQELFSHAQSSEA